MPSWKAWVQRPIGLIKTGGKCKALLLRKGTVVGTETNIDNWS